MRTGIAVLIAAVLLLGVLVFWFSSPEEAPSATAAAPTTSPTSTTTSPEPTTSSSSPISTTTTTEPDATNDHVVETVEEAEQILRELWFGWFEGIYNQDEDRIREVVATEGMLESALSAFGVVFPQTPTLDGVVVDVDILRSDEACLVTYGQLDVSAFRGSEAVASSVQVLRRVEGKWRFATSWVHPNDLWEADCEAELSESY